MKKLFWIDLEMTGLDEKLDHIIEVAVAITDFEFNVLEEYHRVVYQPQKVLDEMNDWCKKHHGASGLTALVAKGLPLAQVETEMMDIVSRHFQSNERPVLAGNSIWNDRRFIDSHLKEFSKRLHYRMIDVSSFKEIFREKFHFKFEKNNPHRAVGDVHESIREMKTYCQFVRI